MNKKIYLFFELIFLFVFLPSLYFIEYFFNIYIPKFPPLLFATIIVLFFLLKDKKFKKCKLWNCTNIKSFLPEIFIRFLILAPFLTLFAWIVSPETFFIFPTETPLWWVLVLLIYPIFSAYPQELLYRLFFFKRYKKIFPKKYVLIAVNTVLFSFLHIVFRNPIAIFLTLFGGLMFAYTYNKSKSLLLVTIEHTLYGLWIFTIGLGVYFFSGI